MATFIACLVVLAFAIALEPTPAAAQIDPRTCGVLDGPGCNPNQCSILDGPGCQAQAQGGGVGENLQLTLGTRAAGDAKKPDGDLNTLRDLFAALRACWTPPAVENAYPGMQMSMRFSLNRDGKLIGRTARHLCEPRGEPEDPRPLSRRVHAIAAGLRAACHSPGALAARSLDARSSFASSTTAMMSRKAKPRV